MYQCRDIRLIGQCVFCGGRNALTSSSTPGSSVMLTCEFCSNTTLVGSIQRFRSVDNLVPGHYDGFVVQADEHSVMVRRLYGDGSFPFRDLISSVLNSAVRLRFKLDIIALTEGAIEGVVKGTSLRLANRSDRAIGLTDESSPHNQPGFDHPERDTIVSWYADLLRLLFITPYRYRTEIYIPGEITRLNESTLHDRDRAVAILRAAIGRRTHRIAFAEAVISRMNI